MKPTLLPICTKITQISTSVAIATLSLSGCQTASTYQTNDKPLLSSHLSQLPATSSDNAHKLMQQVMLHRFDKSYTFDRVTQYQVVPMYDETDIEAKHDSVFALIFKDYGRDNQKPRDLSKEQLACEDAYNEAFNKTLDDFSEEILDDNQVITEQAEQQATYDKCMANAPAYVAPKKDDKDNKKNIAEDDEVTITEDNPLAKRREDFRDAMQKSIEKLDKLEARQAKAEKKKQKSNPYRRGGFGFARTMANLKITPEQIDVINQSFLQNQRLQYSGFYDQKTAQFSTVVEEKKERLGVENYRRVPVLIDLNEMSITLEPDVALPFAGIMFDKALPETIAGKSVKFNLPDNLRQNIPLPLLKDSLINAIGRAYGDIDAEKFNEVVLDDYARSLHASRVIKINMDIQDMGFLFARGIKYWVADLNRIAVQHPEYIKDNEDFKLALELMTKLNRHYRADDVAHLAKIVEAFLPVSFNGYNYYYFDSQNNLIGYRKSRNYSSGLLNAKLVATTINKFSYQPVSDPNKFYQPKANEILDGNALIDTIIHDKKLEAVARDARFEYDMTAKDEQVTSSTQCDSLQQEHDKLIEKENATPEDIDKSVALATQIATECDSSNEVNPNQTAEDVAAQAAQAAAESGNNDTPSDNEDNQTQTDEEESDYQRGSNRTPSYHLSSHMQSDESDF